MMQSDPARIAAEEGITPGSPEQAGAWLFWPTTVRVHPLSKLVRREGQSVVLDARVELRDQTGEPTKMVGTVLLALEFPRCDPPVQRWKVVVATIQEHLLHYDPVTATYRFQLVPEWNTPPATGAQGTLRVFLYGADGTIATASETILW